MAILQYRVFNGFVTVQFKALQSGINKNTSTLALDVLPHWLNHRIAGIFAEKGKLCCRIIGPEVFENSDHRSGADDVRLNEIHGKCNSAPQLLQRMFRSASPPVPFRIGHMILTAEILLIACKGREESLDQRYFVPHGEKVGLQSANNLCPGARKLCFFEIGLLAVRFGIDE